MKKLTHLFAAISMLIMGCENPIKMETQVHEDGSLDKTIVLETGDSSRITHNVFGVSESTGWSVSVEKKKAEENKDAKLAITFKKSFSSAELANKELDNPVDTLFQVHSSFEKQFRWFYTYIRYSETYRPIDRMKLVEPTDYFTPEDRTFINRLPGEDMTVSKADSFYLDQLNQKIFTYYANWGIFKEEFDILKTVVKKNAESKWLDSLTKESSMKVIYDNIDKMKGDPRLAAKMADTLGIPLPAKAEDDFRELSKDLNSRVSFMSFARDGKYQNIIHMPWTIVDSNADSVAGNSLFWKPLVTKFAIQEYEMFVECRELNIWPLIASALVGILTVYAFIRKKF